MSTQVPNDEEYEEDQEPDAPSIQVDLAMLRKTLTSHVDAKLKIEEDIPAEAITAGACELNAFALRTELGDELRGKQRVRRVRSRRNILMSTQATNTWRSSIRY